jgi:starvation-inducible outer membrane lipoprotein
MNVVMRPLLPLAPLLLLAACESEPENIQAKSENQQRALEQRYKEIEAEAENDVAAQVAPLDDEAEALLNQLDSNAAAPANAVNGQ